MIYDVDRPFYFRPVSKVFITAFPFFNRALICASFEESQPLIVSLRKVGQRVNAPKVETFEEVLIRVREEEKTLSRTVCRSKSECVGRKEKWKSWDHFYEIRQWSFKKFPLASWCLDLLFDEVEDDLRNAVGKVKLAIYLYHGGRQLIYLRDILQKHIATASSPEKAEGYFFRFCRLIHYAPSFLQVHKFVQLVMPLLEELMKSIQKNEKDRSGIWFHHMAVCMVERLLSFSLLEENGTNCIVSWECNNLAMRFQKYCEWASGKETAIQREFLGESIEKLKGTPDQFLNQICTVAQKGMVEDYRKVLDRVKDRRKQFIQSRKEAIETLCAIDEKKQTLQKEIQWMFLLEEMIAGDRCNGTANKKKWTKQLNLCKQRIGDLVGQGWEQNVEIKWLTNEVVLLKEWQKEIEQRFQKWQNFSDARLIEQIVQYCFERGPFPQNSDMLSWIYMLRIAHQQASVPVSDIPWERIEEVLSDLIDRSNPARGSKQVGYYEVRFWIEEACLAMCFVFLTKNESRICKSIVDCFVFYAQQPSHDARVIGLFRWFCSEIYDTKTQSCVRLLSPGPQSMVIRKLCGKNRRKNACLLKWFENFPPELKSKMAYAFYWSRVTNDLYERKVGRGGGREEGQEVEEGEEILGSRLLLCCPQNDRRKGLWSPYIMKDFSKMVAEDFGETMEAFRKGRALFYKMASKEQDEVVQAVRSHFRSKEFTLAPEVVYSDWFCWLCGWYEEFPLSKFHLLQMQYQQFILYMDLLSGWPNHLRQQSEATKATVDFSEWMVTCLREKCNENIDLVLGCFKEMLGMFLQVIKLTDLEQILQIVQEGIDGRDDLNGSMKDCLWLCHWVVREEDFFQKLSPNFRSVLKKYTIAYTKKEVYVRKDSEENDELR